MGHCHDTGPMNLPPLRDPFFTYRFRRRLHVLRVLLALALTFLIIRLFEIPHSSWALVSTCLLYTSPSPRD